MPNAPALDTADASSAYPTHCMPPWTTGTEEYQSSRLLRCEGKDGTPLPWMPNARVSAVSNGIMTV